MFGRFFVLTRVITHGSRDRFDFFGRSYLSMHEILFETRQHNAVFRQKSVAFTPSETHLSLSRHLIARFTIAPRQLVYHGTLIDCFVELASEVRTSIAGQGYSVDN